jgi:hypothetical protein
MRLSLFLSPAASDLLQMLPKFPFVHYFYYRLARGYNTACLTLVLDETSPPARNRFFSLAGELLTEDVRLQWRLLCECSLMLEL